jgi:hypothetical protein
MPRFVVLEHDSPHGRHWDFMLEVGQSLATWALAQPPDAPAPIAAKSLPDHRLAYLDYEGPISGGRGSVARWDQGIYQFESQGQDQIQVSLNGQRLIGAAVLRRLPGQPAWQFSFRR